jgi:hypothetical protein
MALASGNLVDANREKVVQAFRVEASCQHPLDDPCDAVLVDAHLPGQGTLSIVVAS